MTSPESGAAGQETGEDLRAEIERLDAEQAALVRQARELRASLTDAGPVDVEERAATITQAEELEELADQFRRRRQRLQDRLQQSP